MNLTEEVRLRSLEIALRCVEVKPEEYAKDKTFDELLAKIIASAKKIEMEYVRKEDKVR